MSRYFVATGIGQHVELEVPDPPPCLFCGCVGFEPSRGGPLVCAHCDMGHRADGKRKTMADFEAGKVHRRAYIEKYKVTVKDSTSTAVGRDDA